MKILYKIRKLYKKKKHLKRKKRGFSLVELLAVVVILGLLTTTGIIATTTLVDKAKKDKMDSQKNTVTLSAQTYMQNNKNLVPKIIGETSIIKVSDLRALKYLTEDITNEKGESCMEKSYVRVYKLSNTEYTYTTFLYCGSEEVPAEEVVPSPIITAKFSDSTGAIKDDLLNNVSDAYLYMEINSATADEISTYKSQGTQIAIDGYSFKIFVYIDSERHEAYNSGSLSGGREEKIVINKKLDDYIDVTDVTEVSIEVTAINTLGGITNASTTIGEHNEKTTISTYDDNVKPKCVKPDSPYSEGDWLNKKEYNTSKEQRKLTVGCNDGTGSGCIRNYFTMSWPNDDDKYGAEYVYIEVKDNAGNVSEHNDECKFRVNVDIQTPEATVTAYVAQQSSSNDTEILADKISGSNILKKTIKVSDSSTTAKIEPTTSFYKSLVGHNTDDKWMNNEKFPYGVIYKIELKDNIRLDRWTWNTNATLINSLKASNYLTVSGSNPDASSGSIIQDEEHGATEFHGSTHDVIYVRFLGEGMRYGVFKAYDKAGNIIEIKIAANLDRTAPPVPNSLNANIYNKVRTGGTKPSSTSYSFGTWTNRYVRVKTASGQNKDNLSDGVTLSGFWQFYYNARNNSGNNVGSGDYSTNESGIGIYDFKGSASAVDGKNKISFKGCDKAGNCSEYGTDRQVWIDITVPVCTVKKSITSGEESSYGWLGIGETARVTATCSDPTSTLASGCTVSSFHYDYNSQINTNKAGANGNGKGGSFSDAAGNSVSCSASERIQIDYEAPTCSVSGGSSAWTNKSRTVVGKCSDTGGSGCVVDLSHTYDYNINTTTAGPAGNGNTGIVYDKAYNFKACASNQTVKVDRTDPYVTVNYPVGEYNGKITVTATCNDDFSGLSGKYDKSYSATTLEPTEDWSIVKCCEDNAGNEICDKKGPYKIKTYGRHPDCGVEEYKTCAHSDCGTYCPSGYTKSDGKCKKTTLTDPTYSCRAGYVYISGTCYKTYTPEECARVCGGSVGGQGEVSLGACGVLKDDIAWCVEETGILKKTCSSGTLNSNNKCETVSYANLINEICATSACGVKTYKQCWHYGENVSSSSGNSGGGGVNVMETR